jgi:polysaccharide biosynthesis protein PslH
MEPLLFLVHRIPYPPNKGDKVRSFHLLRYLSSRYRVLLGALMDDPADAVHVERLGEWATEHCIVPIEPRWQRLCSLSGMLTGEALSCSYFRHSRLSAWVRRQRSRSDLTRVLVYSSSMASYVIGNEWAGHRRIADLVDVDSAKFAQYGREQSGAMGYIYRREALRLGAFERRIAAEFDRTLLVTEPETRLLRELAPESAARIDCMENGVDTAYFDPAIAVPSPYAEAVPVVVFTGAMDYPPNIDAVCWFVRDIWPQVRKQLPTAEFWIVGARPAAAVLALREAPGVAVTGTVPDVRPYLRHAWLSVAPLRLARGVQNKVLEAMAMELPVCASAEALEGIRMPAGVGMPPCLSTSNWVEAVSAVLARGERCREPAARAAVIEGYGWEHHLGQLERLLA